MDPCNSNQNDDFVIIQSENTREQILNMQYQLDLKNLTLEKLQKHVQLQSEAIKSLQDIISAQKDINNDLYLRVRAIDQYAAENHAQQQQLVRALFAEQCQQNATAMQAHASRMHEANKTQTQNVEATLQSHRQTLQDHSHQIAQMQGQIDAISHIAQKNTNDIAKLGDKHKVFDQQCQQYKQLLGVPVLFKK